MTQTSINYARVLYGLSVSPESIKEAKEIFEKTPQLFPVLESPVVPVSQKEKAIKRIFEKKVADVICVLCRHHHAELLYEIFQAYQEYYNEQNQILNAELSYVVPPSKEQLEGIEAFLNKKYGAKAVAFTLKEEKSLVGGFGLRVKDQEFDYSLKGRINALQQKLIWR